MNSIFENLKAYTLWLIGTAAANQLTALMVTLAVAAGIGLAATELMAKLLPWLLNSDVWSAAACSVFSAAFTVFYSMLPADLQAKVVDSFEWLADNEMIALVWKLVWYCCNIVCEGSVLVMCVSTMFLVICVAFAMRMTKGVYDLWPTRG